MNLCWRYNASSLGRIVAEEWIATNDCRAVATISIDDNSLVVIGHADRRRPGITIALNRSWDLGADLAEAVTRLWQRLASPA